MYFRVVIQGSSVSQLAAATKMLLSAAKGFLWMYDSSAQLLYSNDFMIEDAKRKDFLLILGESYVLVFYFKLQG